MAAALALTACLCYGVSNFLGPLLSRENPQFVVLISGQFVAFVVSAAVVVAQGTSVPADRELAAGLVAGVGNALGVAAFYRAAAVGPLSVAAPIGATAAIIPVGIGVAGGESLGPDQVAGIVLAVGGVVLAARRESTPVPGGDVRRCALWAVAAAVGFGVFLSAMAPASDGGTFWAVLVSRASLLVVLFGVAATTGAALHARVSHLPKLALPGVLLFAGTVTYTQATAEGQLSVVSVLGSLFPVVTVALAFVLLGERLSRLQSTGVVAALVGVVLLAAG
ncbi:MAG TPA: DMT family transporter [Thermoleophilaceae bacterium]|nr:DMT family transporter [Thermoleophilaceae bacterium]